MYPDPSSYFRSPEVSAAAPKIDPAGCTTAIAPPRTSTFLSTISIHWFPPGMPEVTRMPLLLLAVLLACLALATRALPSQFDSRLFERQELEALASIRARSDAYNCDSHVSHASPSAYAATTDGEMRNATTDTGPAAPPSEEHLTLHWIKHMATDIELLRFIRFSHSSDANYIFSLLQVRQDLRSVTLTLLFSMPAKGRIHRKYKS